MIKVLQIGMTENIGGQEIYLINQFRELDKSRVQYDFINLDRNKTIAFSDEILQGGSRIFNVISRRENPIRHYREGFNLFKKIGRDYGALVINTSDRYYIYPLLVAKYVGIPMRVLHSHNTGDEKRSLLRFVLSKINMYLANTSLTHRWACSRLAGNWMFGNHEFTVIHDAVDLSKFYYDEKTREDVRKELKLDDYYIIGNVARFSYQKNHEFLINLFREWVKICPKSKLLLVGSSTGNAEHNDYYWNLAHDLVERYSLKDKVIFLGMREDVARLYQAMDCMILPSRFEGLSMVAIESQAASLPFLCSDVLPEEANISENFHMLSLKKDIKEWLLKIKKIKHSGRVITSEQVRKSGFNIKDEIKKVMHLFEKGV